jgi:hypothetical protein
MPQLQELTSFNHTHSCLSETGRSKLGIQMHYIALFELKVRVYEYVMELGVFLWGMEPEI